MTKAMRLYIYLLVLLEINVSFAIRCYSCAGKIGGKQQADDPCLNPAQNVGGGNVNEIDCSSTKLCWKGITGKQLKRGCGEKRCAFLPDISLGSVISQTCCTNDLCNGTSSMFFSRLLIIFLITLSLYFQLYY